MTQFVIDNWMLIVLALVSGGMLLWPSIGQQRIGSIGTAEAVRLINREKAVLIDVGEPDEFAAGHAAGARNVPLGRLSGAKELPTNKAVPVLLLCATGARAARAAATLRKLGHERAIAVSGGNKAWREANLPIEKSVTA